MCRHNTGVTEAALLSLLLSLILLLLLFKSLIEMSEKAAKYPKKKFKSFLKPQNHVN